MMIAERVEGVLAICEHKEDLLHQKLAVILNTLNSDYNVEQSIIDEIEDIYIEKGILYCTTSYEVGYTDGGKLVNG